MNSEELEQSLRTEFDDYLKKIIGEMHEDVSGFQTKVESAIEEHKAHMDGVFKQFTAQFENKRELDEGFKSSIVEHLRLAKDEGARITAQAVADAEQFDEDNKAAPEADFSELRDAISDISKQESQADILKSLVNNAAGFTPRGAFFIVKNDHFVGWRVFGKEEQKDEQAIRDVFFPVSDSTVLSQAARSLITAEGSYGSDGDDTAYLNKLDFGQPDRMYAIPLIARGRSVAVLYADYGQDGTNVNIEALETLVQVAGLTVELLAASRTPKEQKESQPETEQQKPAYADAPQTHSGFESQDSQKSEGGFSYQSPVKTAKNETEEYRQETGGQEFSYQNDSAQTAFQPVSEESDWSQPSEVVEEPAAEVEEVPDYSESYKNETDSYQPANTRSDFSETSSGEYQFDNNQFETPTDTDQSQVETAKLDSSQFDRFTPTESETYTPAVSDSPNDFGAYDPASSFSGESQPQPQTVSEPIAAPPSRTRFSDRNVDLPIEVGEDERRLHNDARRFARLLVSEIKLYNEQKVKEGRESNDVYERLREAIDRSREMYDKRVQSPVSAKFDYFHYELVNSLGDGDESVLGSSYPGASV